jgi:hypothetical protein
MYFNRGIGENYTIKSTIDAVKYSNTIQLKSPTDAVKFSNIIQLSPKYWNQYK